MLECIEGGGGVERAYEAWSKVFVQSRCSHGYAVGWRLETLSVWSEVERLGLMGAVPLFYWCHSVEILSVETIVPSN